MRFVKSSLLALAGVPVLLLAGSGCADNQTSLFVEHALFVSDSDCIVEVDLPSYGEGLMDIAISEVGYSLPLAVVNQLQALGNPDLLRTETNYIRLEGAEMTIEGLSGASPEVSSFTIPFSDTIPPAAGDSPGRAPVILQVVPPGAITEPGSYLVHIVLFGHTLGGTPIEAGEFVWPIRACEGCLFTCEDFGPPCASQRGNDFPHNCAYYGPNGCSTCPDTGDSP